MIYTDQLFTGQREMAGLGIYDYGARFYSPKLGRFLSADTIVPGVANPQALNRYSYVLGNPIRYNDPTGHMCSDPDDPTPSCDGSGTPPPTTPLPNPGSGDNDDDADLEDELILNGGGGKPMYSPVHDDDPPLCLVDPTCEPFSDHVWTEDELDQLLLTLSQYHDDLVGAMWFLALFGGASAFLAQPELALGAVLVGGVFYWEDHNATTLTTYLSEARSIAHEQGGVRITMAHRDNIFGGIPVVIEYEGAIGAFVISTPGLQSAFDVDH